MSRTELREHPEFANLHCLTQLRNAVAHRKAAFLERGAWPKELEPCRSRVPFQPFGPRHWTDVLLVHTVAEWASETAEDWLKLWKQELRL